MNNKVIVRFPPSPTGKLHIGNIRSFLFNYLYARKHNGEIVMRFEDTDLERSKKEYEEFALETLKELGLDFERGPFRQSERTEFYVDAIETLIKNQMAYEAEEREAGNGEKVIRFRNPNKIVSFEDKIRGKISIDTSSFGDFIIARSKKLPLYHLTVVVDDINMGITDVIRGEDHITSTPRQILLIEALGGIIPRYTHLPLIIGEDKKKLGKRHGAVT
ncbi:MAG: glutamate--tRNA ligase family protein [Candidatus Pacebacteria bacterium]|nr:glutamate--tRNA ligase family protein [Candidatus Paceibacterota bacterium]